MKGNIFNVVISGFIVLLASISAKAEIPIHPDWQKHRVTISYVDPGKRLFVASDREFSVPFNTPVHNAKNKPIPLSALKVGDTIRLYFDKEINSKAIKLIELE